MNHLRVILISLGFLLVYFSTAHSQVAFRDNSLLFNDDRKSHPDCTEPQNIQVSIIDKSKLLLKWKGPKATNTGIRYQVRFRSGTNENNWNYIDVFNENYVVVPNIIPDLVYEFQIRKLCDGFDTDYSLTSDWVEITRSILITTKEQGDNPCDAFFGEFINLGNDTAVIRTHYFQANPCGDRYKYRYKLCTNNAEWIEGYIFDSDSIILILPPNSNVCKAQIRKIWGGCNEIYQYFCPWNDLNGTMLLDYNPDPDLTCDGSQSIPPPNGTTPLQTLLVGDRFKCAGIPIIVDNVQSNGSGRFSGDGIAILPFPNLKAKVSFQNISINDNHEVFSGVVNGVNNNAFFKHYQNVGNPKTGQTSCIKEESEWDENGNNIFTGTALDRFGFDKNGKYKRVPPYNGWEEGDPTDTIYDPNGFDSNGNFYKGGKYDDSGCSRDSVDKDGHDCIPSNNGRYEWKRDGLGTNIDGENFFKDKEDSLSLDIANVLNEIIENEENNLTEIISKCAQLKNSIDSISFTSPFVDYRPTIVGTTEEYIQPGLSKEFYQTPQKLTSGISRSDPKFSKLESDQVDLFECDIDATKKDQYIDKMKTLLGKEDSIKQIISQYLKYFNKDSVEKYKDQSEFEEWIRRELMEIIKNRVDGISLNRKIKKDINKILNYQNIQDLLQDEENFISFADLNADSPQYNIDYNLKFKLSQRDRFINGIHRAFYLKENIENRNTLSNLVVNDEYQLPLKWNREVLGKDQTLYLENLSISPTTGGSFDLYYIFPLTTNNDSIVFEATGIIFGPGGVIGASRLHLLKDYKVKLFKSATLNIKGTSPSTFIEFDCDGFAGIGLEAEIEFCREYLTPLTQTLELETDPTKTVKCTLKVEMKSWTDLFTKLDIDPFAITSFPDVRFKVTDAILDYSDGRSDGVVFPTGYKNGEAPDGSVTNSWKGFYLGQLTAYLPKQFSSTNTPPQISVQNVIIDDMGFTGKASYQGTIVSFDEGNLDGWGFSINRIGINVITNKLAGAEFAGNLDIPLFSCDTTSTNDCFNYIAGWKGNYNFDFKVTAATQLKAKLWKATAVIDPGSIVSIIYSDGKWKNAAVLSGSIKIGESDCKLATPYIKFEKITFRNETEYITIGYFGVNDSIGVKFSGFELTIKNPKIVTVNGDPSIKFSTYVKLGDGSFIISGRADIAIVGELTSIAPKMKYGYKGIEISSLKIEMDIKGNKIKGEVTFFKEEDSQGYGTGWRGLVGANFKSLGVSVTALGVFGKMHEGTDSTYKYFLVDAVGEFPGIPLGALKLKGLAGGLYYHMQRDTAVDVTFEEPGDEPPHGQSLSGIVYRPSSIIKFGFKIGVILCAAKEELFNGNANFGMSFTESGSIASIDIFGNARFFTPINKNASLAYYAGPPPPGSGQIVANLSLTWVPGKFVGNLDIYLNAADGNLTGGGPGNLLGRSEMLLNSAGAWYIWSGTPSRPFSVNIAGAKASFYFDIGNTLPPLAPLPSKVSQMLGGFQSTLSTGGAGGVMLGASFTSSYSGNFSIFYASLDAGVGFDLAMLKYKNLICANSNGEIGINGWYAQGRLWGYFDGNIGIQIKRRGKTRTYDIIDLSMAAVMEGGFPNPFYARGAVGGSYTVLGLIKGKCNFKFELGNKCEPSNEDYQEEEFTAIGQITPSEDTKEVNPGTNIGVEMIVQLNTKLELIDDTGKGEIIEVKLRKDSCFIKLDSVENLPFDIEIINGGNNIIFRPIEFLPYNDTIHFHVHVDIYSDGQFESSEYRDLVFYTSGEVDIFPDENIRYSYPIANMSNFYQNNNINGNGYIILNKTQTNINAKSKGIFQARFKGKDFLVIADVKVEENKFFFPIPNLPNNKDFVLELIQPVENSKKQITELKVLCSIPFRTSKFNTFEEKMNMIQNTESTIEGANSISTTYDIGEGFDELEISGSASNDRLIDFYLRTKPGSSNFKGDNQADYMIESVHPYDKAMKLIYNPLNICSYTYSFDALKNIRLPQLSYANDSINGKFRILLKGTILMDALQYSNWKIPELVCNYAKANQLSFDEAKEYLTAECPDLKALIYNEIGTFNFANWKLYIHSVYKLPGMTTVQKSIEINVQ